MNNIKIDCPNCNVPLNVKQSDPDDTEVLCGACGHVFDLPDDNDSRLMVYHEPNTPVPILKTAAKKYNFKDCWYCAETIKINAKICKHCGHTIDQHLKNHQDQQRELNQPGVSRVGFILLGLFLGGLGIHNFYAGYAGRGITQLLLSISGIFLCFIPNIVVFIWNIIELCAVDVDGHGRKMS